MGIFSALLHNLSRGARTRRPADVVPSPAGFRGLLQHDLALCTGCQTCAYVCSPAAITFTEESGCAITWRYFAEQCTFCGRCVTYCPTHALQFTETSPVVTQDREQHRIAHTVAYQPCERCGRPVIPLPEFYLRQQYGDPLPPEVLALRGLCESCRRRLASERLRRSFQGENQRAAE
jgi:hydrogenase-4 component H